jgi:flagellin-like protein
MILGEHNKKALSPLLATVLLIAFAVSIGAMIMSWSIDATEPTSQGVCEQTRIALQELTTGDAICYDEQAQVVRFLIQNTGSVDIHSLTLRVIDEQQNFDEQTLNAQLAPGDIGSWEIRHETTTPLTRVASITPHVQEADATRACPEQQLQEIQLPTC